MEFYFIRWAQNAAMGDLNSIQAKAFLESLNWGGRSLAAAAARRRSGVDVVVLWGSFSVIDKRHHQILQSTVSTLYTVGKKWILMVVVDGGLYPSSSTCSTLTCPEANTIYCIEIVLW